MGSDIYLWIETVIALFIGALLLIDWIKYHLSEFAFLFILFMIILLKSVIYLLIHFSNVQFISPNVIDQNLMPLYDLHYFVFQFIETVYVIVLSYIFIIYRRSLEKKQQTSAIWTMSIQLFIAIALGIVIVIVSIRLGDSTTHKTAIPIIEFFKSRVGRLIFVIWKLVILIMACIAVASVFESVVQLLKNITKYRSIILTLLSIEIVFNIFSSLIPYYQQPAWFLIQIISVILLSVYAFNNHSDYIESIHGKVENLIKEKDIIISLMKEIGDAMGSGDFDLDIVIKTIVNNSIKGTNASAGTILIKDPITNRLTVKYVLGLYPPTKPFKTTQGLTLNETVIIEKFKSEKIAIGEGILGKVAEKGETIYIPDVSKVEDYVQTVEEYMKVISFIAIPLKSKDDVFGVLSVVDDSKVFTENDLSLLETLGKQATITIMQIQMYREVLEKKQAEKEIEVAGEIQLSLIPHTFPTTTSYDIYGYSIPAKGVGGDFYDYIDFGNNKIALTMFDVSGKGVPASLIMVMIRSILRTIASLNEESKEIMSTLNNTISKEIVEDRYATGIYLLFDAEKGIMNYTNAGHGPILIYRAETDSLEFLDTEGMPIGIMSGAEYGQNYTVLEKGDIILLYTDGITEAYNMANEEFGIERVKEIIRKNKRENAKDIASKLLESIVNFVGFAPQHDDETILILKFK